MLKMVDIISQIWQTIWCRRLMQIRHILFFSGACIHLFYELIYKMKGNSCYCIPLSIISIALKYNFSHNTFFWCSLPRQLFIFVLHIRWEWIILACAISVHHTDFWRVCASLFVCGVCTNREMWNLSCEVELKESNATPTVICSYTSAALDNDRSAWGNLEVALELLFSVIWKKWDSQFPQPWNYASVLAADGWWSSK